MIKLDPTKMCYLSQLRTVVGTMIEHSLPMRSTM